ncbi:MAG: class I SAM-dependent methyltransferase [Vicinamibacterales bacterium]
MSRERDLMDENRAHWDEAAAIHPTTEFYDVAAFKRGETHFDELVLSQIGAVAGQSVLHLQCHFGMDTIRFSRLGAIATGVDFSPVAIQTARDLAAELGIETRFIESNVYDLPDVLGEQFELVFTSYGAITWLPDIKAWARAVACFVRPGGRFVIVEGHPAAWPFDDEREDGLVIRYPYFHTPEPLTLEYDGTYATTDTSLTHRRTHNWNHPLGAIINALIDAGLTIEHVGEYPVCAWRQIPIMEKGADGWWRLPEEYPDLPFLFSIRATK